MFWYFVFFIIFGVFVAFNMIISVLLQHWKNLLATMAARRQEKSAGSDSSATAAVNGNVDNEISPSTESKTVKFIRSPHFDRISYFICLTYIFSLMFTHYRQSVKASAILQFVDVVFGLLLIVETILRMVGLGIKPFFKNGWNVFDLVTSVLYAIGKSQLQPIAF